MVRAAAVDETVRPAEAPADYLVRIVRSKLVAVAASVPEARVVLVADTIVVLGGAILGKPVDISDAGRLLRQIAGRVHTVMTRYALSVAPTVREPATERTVYSHVRMRAASESEIKRYAATGEGLDKAGGYAAQGIGAFLVEAIDGSYTNVVGLPLCEVVSDLSALGVLGPFP
jgi:septum formation protein